MAYNPDPRLVQAIRQLGGEYAPILLATTLVESGGRLDAVGDGGMSIGPYQMHSRGRGYNVPPAKRKDPVFSTESALAEFKRFAAKGLSGPELAYAAQRPADRSGYIRKISSVLPEAQRILGSAPGAAAQAVRGEADSPSAPPTLPQQPGPPSTSPALASAAIQAIGEIDTREGINPATLLSLAQARREADAAVGQTAVAKARKERGGRPLSPTDVQREVPGVASSDALGAPAAPASQELQRVLQGSRSALGTPYSWGGGGPGGPSRGIGRGANTVGFDCSGFTEWAWAKAGVKIGTWTGTQLQAGRGINASNQKAWRPGDLIFPHKGHVQLYLGNGMVREAPFTGGRVRDVPVRSGTPYAVRRPLG